MNRRNCHDDEGGALRAVLLTVLLVAVLAGAAYAAYAAGLIEVPWLSGDLPERFVLVAAAPDEDGSVVGQIIVEVDASGAKPTVRSISPTLAITIPGTTYTELGDAYPFGGGAGTVEALARVEGGDTAAYVAIGFDEMAEAVDDAGGIEVDLPAEMAVFDGTTLFRFDAGVQTIDGAELGAVLKGAPYLSASARDELDQTLGGALVRVLAEEPGVFDGCETDLDDAGLAALRDALAQVAQ